MATKTQNQLKVKTFAGCPLTSELAMHLSQSIHWKQLTIQPVKNDGDLIKVHFDGKDYLGSYLPDIEIHLEQLHQIEADIKKWLNSHVPAYSGENLKLYAFVQVFVA